MSTFSQLIDEVASELRRPDLVPAIAAYLNQSIREMHFKSGGTGVQHPAFYAANRFEAQVVIPSDGTYTWPIPNSTTFQTLEAAYVPDVSGYWEPKTPRSINRESLSSFAERRFYRSGPVFVFTNMVTGYTLNLSWFEYPRRLFYQPVSERIVIYNPETDGFELVAGGIPTEEQLLLVTNWLLERWSDSALKEGIRAKVWKRLGDDTRAKMAFSAFGAARQMVFLSEDMIRI
jgi:hypothetical protein